MVQKAKGDNQEARYDAIDNRFMLAKVSFLLKQISIDSKESKSYKNGEINFVEKFGISLR